MSCIHGSCPNPIKVKTRGLCDAHYHALQRSGPLPPIDRFWPKVDKTAGCWLWRGHTNKDGYGTYGGRMAHRLAYEKLVGPIPVGLHIDHLCRVHACVNPVHLRTLTPHDNHSDNSWRDRETCVNGHPWNDENTRMRERNGRTNRTCRACDRGRQAKSKARRRFAA